MSTLSGSFTHRKMPPLGSSNSAAVPNCSFSASISVSTFARSALRSAGRCVAKCGTQYSASIICSTEPEPASVLSGSMRDRIGHGATRKPTRSAGAIDLENDPMWITFCASLIA